MLFVEHNHHLAALYRPLDEIIGSVISDIDTLVMDIIGLIMSRPRKVEDKLVFNPDPILLPLIIAIIQPVVYRFAARHVSIAADGSESAARGYPAAYLLPEFDCIDRGPSHASLFCFRIHFTLSDFRILEY
jgi:hypothetical protein